MSLNTILATAPLTTSGYHIKANGTTLGNSLIWDNGTNVGIGNTNTTYNLDVSGTGRFTGTLIAANSLLVNATAQNGTDSKIYVKQSSDSSFRGVNIVSSTSAEYVGGMFMDGSGNFNIAQSYLGSGSYQSLTFLTSGTERMRITSGGNVIMSPASSGGGLTIGSTTTSYAIGINLINDANTSGNTLATTRTANQYITGTSAGDYVIGAATGKNIIFGNTQTGTNEYMRITSGGDVLVGRTSGGLSNTSGLTLLGSGAYQAECNSYIFYGNRTASDGLFMGIRRNNVDVGSITVTTSSTAFNTSSDYRLKEDLKEFKGLDLVSKIKTYDYKWKIDNSRSYGVIAHELSDVIPYAVYGEKDGEQMQGVDYSKLVPILIKAIQELSKELLDLKEIVATK